MIQVTVSEPFFRPIRCRLIIVVLLSSLLLLLVTASSSNTPDQRRPPFVAHVTREDLQNAMTLATKRHKKAVARALKNFPTDKKNDANENHKNEYVVDTTTDLQKIKLKEYTIDAPGSIPDFVNELGRKVYVTDPQPLLTKEECRHVIEMAERHFKETNDGQWTTQTSGDYEIAGFLIKDVPSVKEWLIRTCRTKLFPLIAQTWPEFVTNPEDLCVDNTYLFKYNPETGRRSDIHTDMGCLSFTIALSDKNDYEGGGTWFEGLVKDNGNGDDKINDDCILEMEQGQVTIRPGGVKHCGYAVKSGIRYVIGGFCMHQNKPEPIRMLLTPSSSGDNNDNDNDNMKISDLEAALVLNPMCDSTYNLLANLYKDLHGDIPKAQEILEYCMEHVHSRSGGIAYPLGCIYYEQSNYSKAKECMDICLQADDCDVLAMTLLGQIYNALQDRTNEEQIYKRIISTSTATKQQIAASFCNLGVLYEGTNDEIGYYLQSLNHNPNSFVARYSLGSAYATREQWMDAIQSFRQAIEIANNHGIEEDPQHANMALQSLYKSAAYFLRSSNKNEAMPQTQQEMIDRMQELMGVENYQKLAAMAQQQRR